MKLTLKFLKFLRKIVLYKILRKTTSGVRVIILSQGKFLLVKHPYDNFWVFPGGKIDKKEEPETAARRELLEEAGFEIIGDLEKLGVYKNTTGGKNDYVTVFVSTNFQETNKRKQLLDKIEIQKIGWFYLHELPEISRATKSRIKEVLNNNYSEKTRLW